jgi:molybdenum cofactor biosynthesis protein MoaC
MNDFTHLDSSGNIRMVDISSKKKTNRTASAEGYIHLRPQTLGEIRRGTIAKGNVLTTAKIAGIQAAKNVPALIPLCHQISLSWIDIEFNLEESRIKISATAQAQYTTGVEMEALTAVSVAALTIYDMCKAADKAMVIDQIRLTAKTGGKSL